VSTARRSRSEKMEAIAAMSFCERVQLLMCAK
jgi:hypothetical protein